MKLYNALITLAPAALLMVILSLGLAGCGGDSQTYTCPDKSCERTKINFGVEKVECSGAGGEAETAWVCEFEDQWECKAEGTGQTISAGADPDGSDLCSHLCGPCAQGWK